MNREDPFGAADRLLVALGAQDVPHPGGTLLAHLRRTRDILSEFEADAHTQLAGLCHAAYGTDGFPHPLLTLEQRPTLEATVGEHTEAIVYLYASCDRQATYSQLGRETLILTDRFTRQVITLEPTMATAFATITIANELDVLRHAKLSLELRDSILALFTALQAYAPGAADRAIAAA